jgi:hypothetical protein
MERSNYFHIWLGMAAMLIAGNAGFFSVFGLSKLFSGATLSVIVMASSLELGKFVSAAFIYRYWKQINWLQKSYMTTAVVVLVGITSAGIFGYLSNAYQGATIEFEKQTTTLFYKEDRLEQLEEDKVYLKEELEQAISELPENYRTAKRQLREEYNPKVIVLNDQILGIKQEVGDLKVGLIETGVDVGPAIYLARAFKTDIDTVVKFFIFILIFVFDPMAVSLIIAYNRVIEDETTEDKPPMNWIEGMSKELKKRKSKVKKQVKKFEEHIIPDTVVIDELQEEENTKVLDKNIGKGGRAGK